MTYRINERLRIMEFDSAMENAMWLMCLDERKWCISEEICYIVNLFSQEIEPKEVYSNVLEKYPKFTIAQLEQIIDSFLYKNGVLLSSSEGETRPMMVTKKKSSIWLKFTIIPANVVNKFKCFTVLFSRPAFGFFLLLLGINVVWISFNMGSDISFAELVHDFATRKSIIMYIILMGVTSFFHEFGHSTGLIRAGKTSGGIGGGIYLYMPVLYADVSELWEIPRKERFYANIGGIYFQNYLLLIILTVYNFLGDIDMITVTCVCIVTSLHNLSFFIKADGYWVLSDLLGVVNLQEVIIDTFRMRVLRKKVVTINNNYPERTRTVLLIYAFFWIVFMGSMLCNCVIIVINYVEGIYQEFSVGKISLDTIIKILCLIILIRFLVLGFSRIMTLFVGKRDVNKRHYGKG